MTMTSPELVGSDPSTPPSHERSRPRIRRLWDAGNSPGVWLGRIFVLLAVLGLWEFLVDVGVLNVFDVSKPSDVWAFLLQEVPTSAWWHNTWVTIEEVVLGLALGGSAGVVAGALLGLSSYVSAVADPYITILNSLPRVALYPLMLTWFGLGHGSKIALVVGIVFFIMLVNTRVGMVTADQDIATNVRVLGASKRQQVLMVDFPSAVPAIFGGLRLSISYGLLAAVTGEMLAAYEGLGQRVSFYATTFRPDGVMGVLLFLALLATVLNLAAGRAESRLLRWQES